MSQPYYVNLSDLSFVDLQNVQVLTQDNQNQLIIAHDPSELIVQEDPNQHIVYSPIKPNEPQYVIQEETVMDSYGQPNQTQQVYYTNVLPTEQQQQQQQQAQAQQQAQQVAQQVQVQQTQQAYINNQAQQTQQQFIFQQSPKVVIQRNPEVPQLSQLQFQPAQSPQQQTHITFEQHNQMIQQHQMQQVLQHQNQMQSQQQQQQHQIVQAAPQYIQLQQIQQQQHQLQQQQAQQPPQLVERPKFASNIVRLNATQQGGVQNIYIRQPPQQIVGQGQQIQQIQHQGQVQQGPKQQIFLARSPLQANRYRYPPNTVRAQTPPVAQQNVAIQQQPVTRVRTPRPRAPNAPVAKRIVSPQIVNQQGVPRFFLQTAGGRQQFVIQQPPPPRPQTQTQQYVQMPQQTTKVVQIQYAKQATKKQEQAEKGADKAAESQQPTTTTLPKKENSNGIDDDLEDSITATVVSKAREGGTPQPSPSPQQIQSQPTQSSKETAISFDEYNRRKLLQQQQEQQQQIQQQQPQAQPPPPIGVVRPMMKQQLMMKSPGLVPMTPRGGVTYRRVQVPVQQQTPPQPQPQQPQMAHRVHEIEAREQESSKMLVILDSGEQRLITFTLPRKTCTVQELLEQVNIRVDKDSDIECIANPGGKIDYVVKVGQNKTDHAALTKAAENALRQRQNQQNQLIQQNQLQQQQRIIQQKQQLQEPPQQPFQAAPSTAGAGSSSSANNATTKVPDPSKPESKFIHGFLAVCAACGATGFDHAKCERCHRVFTENPKSIRIDSGGTTQKLVTSTIVTTKVIDKKDQMEAIQKKHQMNLAEQRKTLVVTSTPTRGRGGAARGRGRGRGKVEEPVIVTLSSDDEADASDSNQSKASSANNSVKKQEAKSVPMSFEPTVQEDVVSDDFDRADVTKLADNDNNKLQTEILCRTIRIGSLKFDPKHKVIVTSKGVRITAPSAKTNTKLLELDIQLSEIVKVIVHFSKNLQLVFVYTKPSCAQYIRNTLEMDGDGKDKLPYYHPISNNELYKRIILLVDNFTDECKSTLKSIFPQPVIEEINNRDANDLLIRSTGTQQTVNAAANASNLVDNNCTVEIKKLLIYPPGTGGFSINTEDYMCLATDQYLNDVIIDFYLNYFRLEILTEDQRSRTHIFSTFFYNRLTKMANRQRPDKDAAKLTASQKRHLRVKKWTKNVNIFEKDFVIIPINEQSHWFLAIICFPYLNEPHTMDTNQPIKLAPIAKRKKKKPLLQIGNTTITPLTKKEQLDSINLNEDEMSERDEAEGEDSDLGTDSDSEEDVATDRGQAVKLPCILIFDSLSGASRSRVVATLRDYLTCEYKAKMTNLPPKIFNKNNMFGNCVKVPQQNNFTDCGLFLLQYVEEFYKNSIKDFRLPIKHLHNWFDQILVTKKREEISNLIKDLIKRVNPDSDMELPEIEFPTKDGKVIDTEDSFEEAFQDEDYEPDEEELDTTAEKTFDSLKSSENGNGVAANPKASPKDQTNDKNVSSSSQGETKGTTRYIGKKRSLEKAGNSEESSSAAVKTPKLSED